MVGCTYEYEYMREILLNVSLKVGPNSWMVEAEGG